MAVVGIVEVAEEPGGLDTKDLAYELVDLNSRLTALTARWLALLGQLSCVDWLAWRCGMSRKTAYERVRVAHELTRRPAVLARFESGSLS